MADRKPNILVIWGDEIGEMVFLWRAVDHESEILESYVTRSRDKAAALRFMKKALKRHGSPEAITTDRLRSYGAAMTELGNADKREVGRHANNRVENSHLPFRRREQSTASTTVQGSSASKVVADRRGGHAAFSHRMADLIEPKHDISRGIQASDAGALMGVHDDAADVFGARAEVSSQLRVNG